MSDAANNKTTPPDSKVLCPDWLYSAFPVRVAPETNLPSDIHGPGWHVAKERGWFTTYKGKRSKVYSQAREDTFEMLGIGTVELRVRSDVDDPTKTDVFKPHVPDVPVNIISHKKLEKAAGWHHVPPADKRTRTLGGLCDCHGEQLAYFRYFDYSNHTAIFQDRHLIPGTKEAPDEVAVPSCAPQGCTLGESTSQNTVLNLPGPLQVRWVTWREEDQKTATSH